MICDHPNCQRSAVWRYMPSDGERLRCEEHVPRGGSFDSAQYWYAWQGEAQDGSYVPISKPEQFADLREFAVG